MEHLQRAIIRKGEQIGKRRYIKNLIFYLLLQEDEVYRACGNKKLDSHWSEFAR